MKLGDVEKYARSVSMKSVVLVGDSMVDVKKSVGWCYADDPDGYLKVRFVFDTGAVVSARLADRNDFFKFLMQTEQFLDDKAAAMPSMTKFVDRIERECKNPSLGDASKTLFAGGGLTVGEAGGAAE